MKFLRGLISPWILVVLKSPTVKTDFLDFLQIQAIFRKTIYITFSYLLIATGGQTVSKKKNFDCGREISILLGIYRHLLLKFKFLTKREIQILGQTDLVTKIARGVG